MQRRTKLLAAALVGVASLALHLGAAPASTVAPAPQPPRGSATSARVQAPSSQLAPFATSSELPADAERSFEGVVEETRRAGSYRYVAVRRPDGAVVWVATLGAGAAQPVGADVSVRAFAARRDFASPRLSITFDRLLFGLVTLSASNR
jgi:hypothetical protein